ncbi:MAG: flagellar basal body rod protein FlgB [Firmicutes bacterium]|nr:flagellar basal body rod protein FlgB [Bacillota bacterium]
MSQIYDNSLKMMETSMRFLWTKQSAMLDNIANAETPGYRPKQVSFEETFRQQLQQATRSADPKQSVSHVLENASVTVTEEPVSARLDENGVNITQQSAELMRNAYQLQYTMSAINSDLKVLRSVIQG